MISWLKTKLGLDRAIGFTVIGNALRVVTGPLTMLLILRFLTPVEQGYYYTFATILAASIFLELGFSQNIVQFTAHEAAHLKLQGNGTIEGEPTALSRLISLGRLAFGYYSVAAVLFVAGIVVVGQAFFQENGVMRESWHGPWWVVCVCCGLNLMMNPAWALLEGFNQFAHVAALRAFRNVAVFAALSGALILGWGLWACAASAVTNVAIGGAYLAFYWKNFLGSFKQASKGERISWPKEIWPLQWRIGLSWLSGYFIFTMIIPVVFKMCSPVEAGKLGMTLQVVRLISTLALSWVSTKVAIFGMRIAKREWDSLDRTFSEALKMALIVGALGQIGLVVVIVLGKLWIPEIGGRLAGVWPTMALSLAAMLSTLTTSYATVLRAYKKEPYLVISVVHAALSLVIIPAFAAYGGSSWAAYGYLVATTCIFVPAVMIFRTKTVEYRANANGIA